MTQNLIGVQKTLVDNVENFKNIILTSNNGKEQSKNLEYETRKMRYKRVISEINDWIQSNKVKQYSYGEIHEKFKNLGVPYYNVITRDFIKDFCEYTEMIGKQKIYGFINQKPIYYLWLENKCSKIAAFEKNRVKECRHDKNNQKIEDQNLRLIETVKETFKEEINKEVMKKDLSDFTDIELFDELKKRGYTGNLNKTIKL
jgi:hypothetical protein